MNKRNPYEGRRVYNNDIRTPHYGSGNANIHGRGKGYGSQSVLKPGGNRRRNDQIQLGQGDARAGPPPPPPPPLVPLSTPLSKSEKAEKNDG